jgi:hypothetical protein
MMLANLMVLHNYAIPEALVGASPDDLLRLHEIVQRSLKDYNHYKSLWLRYNCGKFGGDDNNDDGDWPTAPPPLPDLPPEFAPDQDPTLQPVAMQPVVVPAPSQTKNPGLPNWWPRWFPRPRPMLTGFYPPGGVIAAGTVLVTIGAPEVSVGEIVLQRSLLLPQ